MQCSEGPEEGTGSPGAGVTVDHCLRQMLGRSSALSHLFSSIAMQLYKIHCFSVSNFVHTRNKRFAILTAKNKVILF